MLFFYKNLGSCIEIDAEYITCIFSTTNYWLIHLRMSNIKVYTTLSFVGCLARLIPSYLWKSSFSGCVFVYAPHNLWFRTSANQFFKNCLKLGKQFNDQYFRSSRALLNAGFLQMLNRHIRFYLGLYLREEKRDLLDRQNHGPVIILPTISKLDERAIHD